MEEPEYTTFNNCIVVGRCGYASYNNCITVRRCGYNTQNNCLTLDYKPSATLDLIAESNCEECSQTVDCAGEFNNLTNKCVYINRPVQIKAFNWDLPYQTKYSNLAGEGLNENCSSIGVKYIITRLEDNFVQEVDIPYEWDNENIIPNFDISYIPQKCGLYKIEQIAYNCCMACSKILYFYAKDYLPELDIILSGICESDCPDENNCEECNSTDCNCAEAGKPITISASAIIPEDFKNICPCDPVTVNNWQQFKTTREICELQGSYPYLFTTNSSTYCQDCNQVGFIDEQFYEPCRPDWYVMEPNVVYKYINPPYPEYYYINTNNYAIQINPVDFNLNAFGGYAGVQTVEAPEPTVTYPCAQGIFKVVKFKIYKKYPEKDLIFESDWLQNLNANLNFTPELNGVYIVELYYKGCCGDVISATKEFTTDIKLRPVKIDCYKFKLSSCDVPLDYTYRLYKFDSNHVDNWVLISELDNSTVNNDNVITIPNNKDGIYKLEVINIELENIPESGTYSFVLYEFCGLFECIAKLVRRVICLNKCCSGDCDTPEAKQLRNDLNRLLLFFYINLALIFKDLQESKYAITLESFRLSEMASIEVFMKEMLNICSRTTDDCNC